MIAAYLTRRVVAFVLTLGLAGASEAAPVLSSLVDNGTLSGPQTYTLQVGAHTPGQAFTDSYRFTLGKEWKVSEVSSYFTFGGGIENFAVQLFSLAIGGPTLIGSDLTPVTSGNTSTYSFDVPLAPAGDYLLQVTGKLVGLDYSGSLTLFNVPEPRSVALLLSALLALAALRKHGRRQRHG